MNHKQLERRILATIILLLLVIMMLFIVHINNNSIKDNGIPHKMNKTENSRTNLVGDAKSTTSSDSDTNKKVFGNRHDTNQAAIRNLR